ncbi:MAG: PilZ domain-containing protein [Nitrospirota bacterium]
MELRQSPRFAADLPVSFAAHEFEGLQQGTTYNLSMGGCAVESPVSVEVGTHVALYIHAPGEATPIAIELAAVRRAMRREFAVQFITIQDGERRRLASLIQTLVKPFA